MRAGQWWCDELGHIHKVVTARFFVNGGYGQTTLVLTRLDQPKTWTNVDPDEDPEWHLMWDPVSDATLT